MEMMKFQYLVARSGRQRVAIALRGVPVMGVADCARRRLSYPRAAGSRSAKTLGYEDLCLGALSGAGRDGEKACGASY